MNPYLSLLDDPARLNASEHTGEVLSGMAIPWHADHPQGKVGKDLPTRAERLAPIEEP